MKIGIVGVGFVGGAVSRYFREMTPHEVYEHDPPKGIRGSADIGKCDVVFVCVPTPFRAGRFDPSHVRDAVSSIPGSRIVVVKSTVLPGTTDVLQAENSRHVVLFNPEFLRERCAYEDFVMPDRQIIGCGPGQVDHAARVMQALPAAHMRRYCTRSEAEMVKYFSNCYLSMRVTFANQMYELCEANGVDYAAVRGMAEGDPRIGSGYLDVSTDGYRGYGGTCFPKDMRALIQLGSESGAPQTVLEECERVNNVLLARAGKAEWLP